MKVENGTYLKCPECEAPYRNPLPEGWTYTIIGNYGLGAFVTSHKPGCPRSFPSTAPADE